MSNNKTIKKAMIDKFGDECMMEEAGIRYMPNIENESGIEADDRLEYHHIKPVKEGGLTTIANGALIKGYNHRWLHQQSPEKQAEINRQLQEYKVIMELKKAKEKVKKCEMMLAEMRKDHRNLNLEEER